MKRFLIAMAASALASPIAPVAAGTAGNQSVGYYSPDVARLVSGQPIFPSDAHRENEFGLTLAQPAGLPTAITELRGVNVDGLARQDGRFVLSIDVAAIIGGSRFFPGDVFRCNNDSCTDNTLLLDGVFGIPRSVNVDGVGFDRDTGDLLYSIDADASYDGSTFFAADIIRYNGSSHTLVFDGRRLPDGVNIDGLDGTAEGFLFSTDIDSEAPGVSFRNYDIVAFNANTLVYGFTEFRPSGNWDGANLDALYGDTLGGAQLVFADGFEAP